MKINTKAVIVGLKKSPIIDSDKTELTVGIAVSRILAGENHPDPLKCWLLAKRFREKDEIELDLAEFEEVKNVVKKTQNYTPLVTGQILEIFSKLKIDDKP